MMVLHAFGIFFFCFLFASLWCNNASDAVISLLLKCLIITNCLTKSIFLKIIFIDLEDDNLLFETFRKRSMVSKNCQT